MTGIIVYTTEQPTKDATAAVVQTLVDTIKRESFVSGYKASNTEAFGLLMARYFSWNSDILEAAAYALEDANFHTQSGEVKAMHEAITHASDDEPYDDSMRKALFARMNEVYGKLERLDRLERLSVLVGRRVHTMSLRTANPITRGEFARAMDLMGTLVK